MSARRLSFPFVLVVAIALALWLLLRSRPAPESADLRPAPPVAAAPRGGAPDGGRLPAPAPAAERSLLAADLNAPGGSVDRDLLVIDEVLAAWRSNFPRDGNPVGENVEITAALTGRNDRGVACPARPPGDQRAGRTLRPLGHAAFLSSARGRSHGAALRRSRPTALHSR